MLDSPHTSAPMLMRGNTPPTTRSPPHQSRPAGYPPNRQPVTVGEEERDGRGTTSRRTSTRAAPERRPPPTVRHAPTSQQLQPPQGRGPSQAQDCRAAPRGRRRAEPGTGPHRRPPRRRNLPRHAPCQPQQEGGKGRCPVVSNRPLHRAMQQRCHHASASARSPSSPPMPRPRLQRAATARQEKFQLPIAAQNLLWMRNSSLHSREHCNALLQTIHLFSRTQYRLDSTGMARKWDCWVSTPLPTTSMLQTVF
jgi:hypothetical protein